MRMVRQSQKDNHTMGRTSFAVGVETLKQGDPSNQGPSLAALYAHTRKRTDGRKYKTAFDETAAKIDAMENYVPPEDGSGPVDPYMAVMGPEKNSQQRLHGRGVTKKMLKKVAGCESTYMVPADYVDTLMSSVEAERDKLLEMQKKMEEDHKKMEEELERKKAELDEVRQGIMAEKDKLMSDVLAMVNAKLGGQQPNQE